MLNPTDKYGDDLELDEDFPAVENDEEEDRFADLSLDHEEGLDDDFIGMEGEAPGDSFDDISLDAHPEEIDFCLNCGEDEGLCECGLSSVTECTDFDKFMDKIVLSENRVARRAEVEDCAAVRYNKRYGEHAHNRIRIKR